MKKNLVIITILLALIGLSFWYIGSINDQKLRAIVLEEDLKVARYTVTVLENKLSEAVHENSFKEVTYEEHLDQYKDLIDHWISLDPQELRKSAYKVSVSLVQGERVVDLPKEGILLVTPGDFSLEIDFVKPDWVYHEDLNDYLQYYGDVLHDLTMTQADLIYRTDRGIKLLYQDIKEGEQLGIDLPDDLADLLGLDHSHLSFQVADHYGLAQDYLPLDLEKKVFSGGYEKEGYTEHYEYGDQAYGVIIEDASGGQRRDYTHEGDWTLTSITNPDQEAQSYNQILLPEKIKLGYVDSQLTYHSQITGLDILVDSPVGTFKTVEVRTDYDGGLVVYNYYAKGLGLVLSKIGKDQVDMLKSYE